MPKLLILFVHGLAGAQASWGSFERLLTTDAELNDRIEIAFYNFPTRLGRWLPTWKSVPLQDLARGLATEMRTKFATHPKILLVCHSLGGLVAKRFISETVKQSGSLSIREVVFFATPHFGARLANVAEVFFAFRHRHLLQLKTNSDFIELINEDWSTFKCEARVGSTYVIGGQDSVVSRTSAGGAMGVKVEVIPGKGHIDIVKPDNESDIAFLLVKQAALRLLTDSDSDLVELSRAIDKQDAAAVRALITNRGRSWIETTEGPEAIALFERVSRTFDEKSIESIWSQYLIAIARLFRDRVTSADIFDDSFLERAEMHGLRSLVLAERMEFARKRRDPAVLAIASELEAESDPNTVPTSPINAYALGVSFFLMGNLLRAGGRYHEASEAIARARSFYRPPILAHQIELAHCQYALAVCRSMVGATAIEEMRAVSFGPGLRRFVDALTALTQSHIAWSRNELGEAIERADGASLIFQQLRFVEYGRRATSLTTLLTAWRRLELGAASDQALSQLGEDGIRIQGMLGDKDAIGGLFAWISRARPSRAIGMFQFASAYNPNWTEEIGKFELPPTLERVDGRLQWKHDIATSLAEADAKLRRNLGIGHDARLPLLAD